MSDSKLQWRRDSSRELMLWVYELDRWMPYKQSSRYHKFPDKPAFSPGYPFFVGCLKLGYDVLEVKNAE